MQRTGETGMAKGELDKLLQMSQAVQKEQRTQTGREAESEETQREAKGLLATNAGKTYSEDNIKGKRGKGEAGKWKGKIKGQIEGGAVGIGKGNKVATETLSDNWGKQISAKAEIPERQGVGRKERTKREQRGTMEL